MNITFLKYEEQSRLKWTKDEHKTTTPNRISQSEAGIISKKNHLSPKPISKFKAEIELHEQNS